MDCNCLAPKLLLRLCLDQGSAVTEREQPSNRPSACDWEASDASAWWPQGEVTKTTLAARDWLQEHRMIVWDGKEQRWGPTILGVAVMASSMDPDVSLEYIQVRPTPGHCRAVYPGMLPCIFTDLLLKQCCRLVLHGRRSCTLLGKPALPLRRPLRRLHSTPQSSTDAACM